MYDRDNKLNLCMDSNENALSLLSLFPLTSQEDDQKLQPFSGHNISIWRSEKRILKFFVILARPLPLLLTLNTHSLTITICLETIKTNFIISLSLCISVFTVVQVSLVSHYLCLVIAIICSQPCHIHKKICIIIHVCICV